MGIIWILENQDSAQAFFTRHLQGTFPVRSFSSSSSLSGFLEIEKDATPSALLINQCSFSPAICLKNIECSVPLFEVGDHGERLDSIDLKPNRMHYTIERSSLTILDLIAIFKRLALGMFRKQSNTQKTTLAFGDVTFQLDKFEYTVTSSERKESLPLKEALLLNLFMKHPNTCLNRDQIRASVWNEIQVAPRTIDSHISRLRGRLKDSQITIESVYGGGYILR